MPKPFHLAIPVHDLATAREFYGNLLNCEEGRSDQDWVDFNFYGHQLVCHQVSAQAQSLAHNPVDDHDVPVPHFGLVMEMHDWQQLADHLKSQSVSFVIEPYIRFAGQPGEQATMFLLDPSGNALEFKAFRDIDKQLFQR